MISCHLSPQPIDEIKSELELIFVIPQNLKHRFIHDKKLLKKAGFNAKEGESLLLYEQNRLYVALPSLGANDLRVAGATAMQALQKSTYQSLKVASYSSKGCLYAIRAMVEGFILGSYSFDRYKSQKSPHPITEITLSLEHYFESPISQKRVTKLLDEAMIVAEATNFTRDIVNTPPEDCYPKTMADIAKTLSDESSLSLHILKPKALKKEKMHTLLAVARASRHTPRVIHLSHKPKNAKKVITLVGKGLTYDSGGLSLKPSDFMVTMKADKSGGSAILGIMRAVERLNLPIEVHGFIGAVENMIGGDAYKPDDVLVAKNGKTIEVRNTDAEGRLVLADLLCYAQQEVKADYLFDFATLTGASVVAVGNYTSSIMGHNKETQSLVVEHAHKAGEYATALDFNPYLKKTLNSTIADICNISNTRYGGAITAGQFLSEFVDEEHAPKWAHIDIAGPAFVEHAWGENPSGASGAGVRMMIKLLEHLSSEG
jgi:leucyl aminopeptidase